MTIFFPSRSVLLPVLLGVAIMLLTSLSGLQPLSFLPNVWQFGIDLLILSVAFTSMQITGFSLLVLFYVADSTYSIFQRLAANKKQFACNDEGYQRL